MGNWEPTTEQIEEKLTEMAYTWGDIEEEIELEATEGVNDERAQRLSELIGDAFRVEAFYDRNQWDDPCTSYLLLFDVAAREARDAAHLLTSSGDVGGPAGDRQVLSNLILEQARPWHTRDHLVIKTVHRSTPIVGKVCRRLGQEHPPGMHPELLLGPPEPAPEAAAEAPPDKAERKTTEPAVSRTFARQPQLETPAAFPDWDLVRRVEALLRQYEDTAYGIDSFRLAAEDERGVYEAPELDALRLEFDERGSRGPRSTTVTARGGDYIYYVRVGSDDLPYARLEGKDEITVNGIASRLQEIFRDAAPESFAPSELNLGPVDGSFGMGTREPKSKIHPEEETFTERLSPPYGWPTYATLLIGAAGVITTIVIAIVK